MGADTLVRIAAFAGLLALFALLEALAPDRAEPQTRARRWPTNLALTLFGALLARLAPAFTAVGAAAFAARHDIGLLNALDAGPIVATVVTLVALDLALYLQHRAMHVSPLLWRLHAVHHADPVLDVTTGLRFHPAEIALSMLWKALVVVALGAPAAAVVAFEIALNGLAMFNHANWRLPRGLQAVLAPWLVTPRAHRLHHDRSVGAHAPNYGFSVTLWDKLFRTWREGAEPARLGLDPGPDDPASLRQSLVQPLR